jgi:signal transduction histidine kinase
MRAESGFMPAAPPGVVETGVPAFFVLGPESLGFSTPPTDLHLLPDGRVLVVSQHEIAIGDGVRWETFQQAANQSDYIYNQVAVDGDGRIYTGIPGAIARIDLGEDARWRLMPVVSVAHRDPCVRVAQLADTWFWYAGGGSGVAWRPGQSPRIAGMSGAIEHVFCLGTEQFLSDTSSGLLYRLRYGDEAELFPLANALVTGAITCSADYGPDQKIVGSEGEGIRVFDGKSLSDITIPSILGPGCRINDLCRIDNNLYAAAVDTTGIVFFTRGGRIVQMLDHVLDHRLARARRLVYSHDGVLWALLDNALACVQFPSQISNFEPILASAITYARPLRHGGKLWLLADGRLQRAIYNTDGCVERFEQDSPPGKFLWAIAETAGHLFATNDDGIFVREGTGWRQIAAGITNARIGIGQSRSEGEFFYVARGEIGWIRESGGHYAAQRLPVKGLGDVYNAVEDSSRTIWLELGSSRVGRIDFGAGEPTVRMFDKADGLGDGWANLFVLDGTLLCNSSHHMMRFDAPTQRFVEDRELIRRIPLLVDCQGRPERDASGRLWFSCHGAVRFVDDTKTGENPPVGTLPLGFEPTEFNMESGGVIWMQTREHLIRFDSRLPHPLTAPPRAQITSVQLVMSNRHLFNPAAVLPALHYADNSLVVRFATVFSPFESPVTFEVLLEGATDQWVSTGIVGSASFNGLKEGRYVFHVRPVTAGVPGKEARMAFSVRPPWFRAWWAWVIYVITAITLVLSIVWFNSYLERRERERLERLVAERTAELGQQVKETLEKSAALGASEERYRQLNTELEARVVDRTAQLSKTNVDLKREIAERQRAEQEVDRVHKQLLTASHEAGMAEVATGVLHNVGNVLNSVNVSARLATERLRALKISSVSRVAQLLREQGDRLAQFLTEDVRGQKVPAYLDQLAAQLEKERAEVEKELSGLVMNVDHINQIVAMQQSYARVSGFLEPVALADLVEDAIKIHGGAFARHGIELAREFEQLPPVLIDKHKVLQILVNLVDNSKHACDAATQPEKRVTIRIQAIGPDREKIEVSDTGVGIPPENLTRIFSQGFTTRKGGHGFGLHSAVLAAHELGGRLTVQSDGLGHGATFTLELPLQPPSSSQNRS